MSWMEVTTDWPVFVARLAADFPQLDPEALRRFRGDRAKLVIYLAETHDLTAREASEVLRDWFDLHGRALISARSRVA